MSQKSLISYYKEIFQLKRYGSFDLNEINELFPYEMVIYSYQVLQALEEEKKQQ